jgi:N-ethylmaleimide reductase
MTEYPLLFSPLRLGAYQLQHRVVMAPLTRMRASQPGDVPNELNAEYYRQRASVGGLIISEATQVMPEGKGYPQTPGIYSDEQVAGWKLATDAVHAKGGLIFLQLWHVGRSSHSSLQPGGKLPMAPSALPIRDGAKVLTPEWKQVEYETPRALEVAEIATVVEAYRKGAVNAKAAGFDGVEIHGANGYLLDQFLEDRTNNRTDQYGGPIENRARLLLEVVDAAITVWGEDKVGVRLSPYGKFNDMGDSDPLALFTYVLNELSRRGVAYAHVIEPRAGGGGAQPDNSAPRTSSIFRNAFNGVFISAGGYDAASAEQLIEEGLADAVAFGRIFIANPDLPERFRNAAPLNEYDRSTFYGGTEKGYTDYPALEAVPSPS